MRTDNSAYLIVTDKGHWGVAVEWEDDRKGVQGLGCQHSQTHTGRIKSIQLI